jgi:DNA mismatch repair protein MSH2
VWKKYEDQQAAIVSEMMSVGSGYADLMVHLGDVISRLDVAVGLAVAALTAPTPFIRPQVNGGHSRLSASVPDPDTSLFS